MLAFLPTPFEDELLYSLLARSLSWLGGTASLPVIQAAFGRGATGVRVALPGGLAALAEALAPGCRLDVPTIVNRHTLLPYFLRLLMPLDSERLLRGTTAGWRHGGYAGLSPFRGASHWHRALVLCPDCVALDVRTHGEAAWRRSHQLPGVLVCPAHGAALRASRTRAVGQSHLIRCPTDVGDLLQVENPFERATAWRLARASQWLLHNPSPGPGLAGVRRRLRSLLAERGWLKPNGMVRAGLHEAVEAAYGRHGLATLGVCLAENRGETDIQRLWTSTLRARVPPLKLLLLLDFLGVDVAYLEDGQEEAASSPQTSKRRPQISRPTVLQRHRAYMRELVRADRSRPRTLLRKLAPVPYCYLLRHDRPWLETLLPPPRKSAVIVDWNARDRALAAGVRAAADRLAGSGVRLRMITASTVATEAGRRSSLLRRAGQSPVLAAALAGAVERLRQARGSDG